MQPPRKPTLAEQGYVIVGREGSIAYYDDGRGDVRAVRVDAEGRPVERPRLCCGVKFWEGSAAARRIRERPSAEEQAARVVLADVAKARRDVWRPAKSRS